MNDNSESTADDALLRMLAGATFSPNTKVTLPSETQISGQEAQAFTAAFAPCGSSESMETHTVSVVRHWFGTHAECDCGYRSTHYVFVAAATNMALTHAYLTGHMPARSLIAAHTS